MPIGVISNVLSVAAGGAIGSVLGGRLSSKYKDMMNLLFGICAMSMGINSIILMEQMPVMVFSVLIGTSIGYLLRLGDRVTALAGYMQRLISRFIPAAPTLSQEEFDANVLTVIVLFCASGTGIYGAMVEGLSGDSSILLAKSIMDVFTALIFACSLGPVVSFIAAPQLVIFLLLYACGGFIFPYTTPVMVNDFKAVCGVLLLATGFRVSKIKMFPLADMIPAMIIAMPVSWFWTNVVSPLMH